MQTRDCFGGCSQEADNTAAAGADHVATRRTNGTNPHPASLRQLCSAERSDTEQLELSTVRSDDATISRLCATE